MVQNNVSNGSTFWNALKTLYFAVSVIFLIGFNILQENIRYESVHFPHASGDAGLVLLLLTVILTFDTLVKIGLALGLVIVHRNNMKGSWMLKLFAGLALVQLLSLIRTPFKF